MKPLFKKSQDEIDNFLPPVREDIKNWQLITVSVTPECILPYDEIIAKLIDIYNGFPGIVYNAGYYRVFALVKMDKIENFALTKKDLQKKLPQDFCYVNLRMATPAGLDYLSENYMKPDDKYYDDFQACEENSVNKILVADDDAMIVRVMGKVLQGHGEFYDVQAGDDVLEAYKTHLPDLVFLDIHMPGVNGLDNIEKILDHNPFAYVVVFSSDSVASKILTASERGAAGFIGKPIQKGRVLNYLKLCPTTELVE